MSDLYLSVAVDLEPVGADQVLLIEHGVVRAQEVEILKLKNKKKNYRNATAGLMKTVPPVYTLLMVTIYLSHSTVHRLLRESFLGNTRYVTVFTVVKYGNQKKLETKRKQKEDS